MPKTRVIIVGAGIGGLSAAHELLEMSKRTGGATQFQIDCYEAGDWIGGKARSQLVKASVNGNPVDVPGEHGFRFCPHFYRHFTDTLKTIPVGAAHYDHDLPPGSKVFDRLKA